MIGGVVIETLLVPLLVENDPEALSFGQEREARVWVNAKDKHGGTCAIQVADTPAARCISEGDSIWWQGRHAFWTPKSGAFSDYKLQRIGYSGVSRPSVTVKSIQKANPLREHDTNSHDCWCQPRFYRICACGGSCWQCDQGKISITRAQADEYVEHEALLIVHNDIRKETT